MACLLVPAYDAVMVTGMLDLTTAVVIVKVAVVAPAATRTDAGAVVTAVLLLLRDGGATGWRDSVQRDGSRGRVAAGDRGGLSVSELTASGSRVRTACLVTPL